MPTQSTKRESYSWIFAFAGIVSAIVGICLLVGYYGGKVQFSSKWFWSIPAAFVGTVLLIVADLIFKSAVSSLQKRYASLAQNDGVGKEQSHDTPDERDAFYLQKNLSQEDEIGNEEVDLDCDSPLVGGNEFTVES